MTSYLENITIIMMVTGKFKNSIVIVFSANRFIKDVFTGHRVDGFASSPRTLIGRLMQSRADRDHRPPRPSPPHRNKTTAVLLLHPTTFNLQEIAMPSYSRAFNC